MLNPGQTHTGIRSAPVGRRRGLVTANLLGVPFGLAGLGQCWSAAHTASAVPAWPADLVFGLSAATWLVVSAAYLQNVRRTARTRTELSDATYAPFIALLFIVPMIVGVASSTEHEASGTTTFFVAMVLTVLYGGWLTGQWVVSDIRLAQWHPGYLLPTVAGGLIASAGCAVLGYESLARLMFGYGTICWLVLGTIIFARLFTESALPTPLVPTLAILVAPPVVAGNAWLEINGHRSDGVVLFLSGYAVVMVAVQVRLIPVYARLSFAPGWWAFSFSFAAATAFAIRWLNINHTADQPSVIGLLSLATLGIGTLCLGTMLGLWRGSFLPAAAASTCD